MYSNPKGQEPPANQKALILIIVIEKLSSTTIPQLNGIFLPLLGRSAFIDAYGSG
jgi:hypothetical protein